MISKGMKLLSVQPESLSPKKQTLKKLNSAADNTFTNIKQFSSNNTLLYYQGTIRPTYYLTAYVRAKVISISKISYQEMSANLNCQLLIDISYRGVDIDDKNRILQKGIRLSFEKDQMLLLTRDNPDVFIQDNEAEKRIQFVIRKFIKTGIACQRLFLSPFEIINCQIALRINNVKIKVQNEADEKSKSRLNRSKQNATEESMMQTDNEITCEYNFNMMDHQKNELKVSNSIDSNFGLFQIASAMLSAKYFTSFEEASEKKKKEKQNKKIKNKGLKKGKKPIIDVSDEQLLLIKKKYGDQKLLSFNVGVFYIPLFKKPVVTNLTIFLPLIILSLTNLGIFFCQPDIFKRIGSIAAIMVSFFALVPTMRSQIPPTSTITLVQLLVFIEASTAIIALIHSIMIIGEDENWQFDYMNSFLFWLSVAITAVVNIIVIVLSLTYILKWKPKYTNDQRQIFNEFKQGERLNIYEWSNERCDAYFKALYEKDTIKVIQDVDHNNYVLAEDIFELGLKENNEEMEKMQNANKNNGTRKKF